MSRDILAIAEIREGELDNISFDLICKGRELADRTGAKLFLLLMGNELGTLVSGIEDVGPDTILVAGSPALEHYNPETYGRVIRDVVGDVKPALIMLGYTYWGIELGPSLAVSLDRPIVTNCITLEYERDIFKVTRPMFSGITQATVELQGPRPYIVSFQKGVLPRQSLSRKTAEVIQVPVELDDIWLRSKVIDYIRAAVGDIDITKADVIVSIGRGITDKANIPMVMGLADALGGVIACSRPIADIGWLPREYHVGMSGKTVSPKVYIACGISGASQHVVGMSDSQCIIAINKDANAPIFDVAHYGIVGDLFEIIPAIIKEVKATS